MLSEIFGVLLLLVVLPGTIELALLTIGAILPKKEKPLGPEVPSPKICLLVPAHNEEAGIVRTLRSLHACPDPFTLVVIADNCTDRTVPIVKALGVRVLERIQPGQRGKHFALKFAFEHLLKEDFDLFAIIDADTIVGPNLIDALSSAYKRGAQAIQVRYALERPYDSYKKRLLNVAFSAFNYLRPRGRQRLGFSGGILGNGFALSRTILEKIPFGVNSVVEDLAYHLLLVKNGEKVFFIDTTAVYSKMASDKSAVDVQRVRWEGGRLKLLMQQFGPLVREILKGNFPLIEPLLDLLLPPLGYYFLLLLLLMLIPNPIAKSFALLGGLLLLFHTFITINLIRGGWRDYLALLLSPFYIFEKIGRLGKILKGAFKGEWTRTPRDK